MMKLGVEVDRWSPGNLPFVKVSQNFIGVFIRNLRGDPIRSADKRYRSASLSKKMKKGQIMHVGRNPFNLTKRTETSASQMPRCGY